MKKIPTLFERQYANHKVVGIKPNVTEGMEWVLDGEGIATVKIDGSCCAIINGEFYKRYDAKKGKKAPEGAIPCCEPDAITGHHPHWVKVDPDNSADKWFAKALTHTFIHSIVPIPDGTYEAIGPHFQGNPYRLDCDILVKHGQEIVEVERSFEGIREWLRTHNEEGLVFWRDGEPKCKIKRSDFGFFVEQLPNRERRCAGMTDLKVGDLVEVNKMDIGVITYIDEKKQIAEVEIERYDYKTEFPYPIRDLRKF